VGEAPVLVEANNRIEVEGRVRRGPRPTDDGITPDTLAYYLPFHFYCTTWGIYVRAEGVWALARRLVLPKKLPDARFLDCAYYLLLNHERLHFFAEYAAARIEVVTAQSCYERYFKDKYAALHEEALANAHALRGLLRGVSPKIVQAASAWMTTQGPGYCEFGNWLPPRFTEGERRAAARMTPAAALTNRLSSAEHPAEFLFRNTSSRPVPVYIVLDPSVPWVRVVKPFPKDFGLQVLVYTNDHKPPHIHIECPPGTRRTRYRWPELTPLRGDQALRVNEEKRLRQYVDAYGGAIERKVTTIPWN
jgi:hypothetical protein